MNRFLPALLLFTILVTSCKKDKSNAYDNSDTGAPVVNRLEPSMVTSGSLARIIGSNLGSLATGGSVLFDGKPAIIQAVSATEVKVVVPALAKGGEVTLVIDNRSIKGPAFAYSDLGLISGISPAWASAGALVRIMGPNLGAGPFTVSFNGVAAEVMGRSAAEIWVRVPMGSTGNVLVSSGDFSVQGPVFNFIGAALISEISPVEVTSGTVVTLKGSNFGTDQSAVQVLFNGKAGSISSFSEGEIKVTVPVTTTGNVSLSINGISTSGPAFIYMSPLTSPYSTGNVVLASQAEVDAFVNQNLGRQLRISGSLSVTGNDITSTSGLSNIVSVAQNLTVSGTALSELGFLNSISLVGGNIYLRDLGATVISMDGLSASIASLSVTGCKNLRRLRFGSLRNITEGMYSAGLSISGCEQLSEVDFTSLGSVTYKLSLNGLAVRDLSGFSSLKAAGSLVISSNPSLASLKGLENLNALTLSALSQVGTGNPATSNGLNLTGNARLGSLDGLQNLKSLPLARISGNTALSELCPFKAAILKLSTTPDYFYYRQSLDRLGSSRISVAALSMVNNGPYASMGSAVEALALCK